MKKQRALFEAVSGIDPALIQEATQPRRLHKPLARRVFISIAYAAVLAIVLTAILWNREENYITTSKGLYVIAHASSEEGSEATETIVLQEGVIYPTLFYQPPIANNRRPCPISFSIDDTLYPDATLTLEIQTNAGIFSNPHNESSPDLTTIENALLIHYGQHFHVPINETLNWRPIGFDYEYMKLQCEQGNLDLDDAYVDCLFDDNPSYIDVIIRADNNIVGYCVIKITEVNGITGFLASEFTLELVTMTLFPKVDNDYQKVSRQYVLNAINDIHTSKQMEP